MKLIIMDKATEDRYEIDDCITTLNIGFYSLINTGDWLVFREFSGRVWHRTINFNINELCIWLEDMKIDKHYEVKYES
jgi:hypothetical protein